MTSAAVQVSFVVPAYNEAVMLGATLRALYAAAGATGKTFEVIVVDDASTDATAKLAREHGAKVVAVDLHRISAVRNAGARAASGELLVFVDADTLITAQALAGALEAVRRGAVGGGARVRMDVHGLPVWKRAAVEGLCWTLYRVGVAGGCFLFARRDAFDAVGGFDERYFASEEIHFALALRKRGRFVLLPDAITSSGRKLRLFPGWQIPLQMLRVACGGLAAVRRREGLDFWYDGRRESADLRQSPPDVRDR